MVLAVFCIGILTILIDETQVIALVNLPMRLLLLVSAAAYISLIPQR